MSPCCKSQFNQYNSKQVMSLNNLIKGTVKIYLQLTWVMFAVGTWWSALGVRCRAQRREEKAEVSPRQ